MSNGVWKRYVEVKSIALSHISLNMIQHKNLMFAQLKNRTIAQKIVE